MLTIVTDERGVEYAMGVFYDDLKHLPEGYTLCNTCGRAWNDTKGTSVTPAPSARCPFEYDHDSDRTVYLKMGSHRAADRVKRLLQRDIDWYYTWDTGGNLVLVSPYEHQQIKQARIPSVTRFTPRTGSDSQPKRCISSR
jgi:hypothetical protein